MLEALARLVVRAASWLVPRRERASFRLEWSSEMYPRLVMDMFHRVISP